MRKIESAMGGVRFWDSQRLVAMEVQAVLLALALLCFSPGANCGYKLWIRQASNERLCSETPQGFRDSFISKCTMLLMNDTVCVRAWNEFSRAFAGRDPATVVGR